MSIHNTELRHLALVAESNVHNIDVARRHRADLLREKRAAKTSTSDAGRDATRSPFTYPHALGRDGPDAA